MTPPAGRGPFARRRSAATIVVALVALGRRRVPWRSGGASRDVTEPVAAESRRRRPRPRPRRVGVGRPGVAERLARRGRRGPVTGAVARPPRPGADDR